MRSAVVLAGIAALLVGCGPSGLVAPYEKESVEPLRVARPCSRSQLEPSLYLQGATSKLVGRVTFRVTGARRCSVFPFSPHVWFSDTSQRVKAYEMPPADPRERGPHPPRSLQPGDDVAVDLEWSNWCAEPPDALLVAIRFSGTYRLRLADTPPCLAKRLPSSLGVGPAVPVR
jgi:hypothetical protein